MSGERRVEFLGDGMAAVVHGARAAGDLFGELPVVVGGLAVMCRLTRPYRATTDLDLVDRLDGARRQLEVLRAAPGAQDRQPAAAVLRTPYGPVIIDVLEVRQIELDRPSDDPGDRLHVQSHAWAHATATPVSVTVLPIVGEGVAAEVRVAEPGPLVAMKLQALMDRSASKQGTDLQDIVRLVLDRGVRETVQEQLASCSVPMRADIALHVRRWLVERQRPSLRRIHDTGGRDLGTRDLDLVADLLLDPTDR